MQNATTWLRRRLSAGAVGDAVRNLRATRTRAELALDLARRRDYLLVVSHMRSYSTLLGHLLASSGEVSGYSEMRRSYRAEADLMALAWQVRSSHEGERLGTVVLDKVLHKEHWISDDVLALPNVQVLLSVREPEATLRSIIAMGIGIKPGHWWSQPNSALQHYLTRMQNLKDLSDRIEQPLVLRADGLVEATSTTLLELQQNLGLRKPLTADYGTHAYTGKAEYGDTSDYISSGRVQAARSTHDDIDLGADLIAQAEAAHADFWQHMRSNGATIIGNPS